ncbi:MAG TPA: GTPase [Pirellulales bacterium]|jgi:hypothetical protein|nr:GTPase [Pirellulales bacterium]
MATNLTPQYHRAEEQYRRAATKEEELKWLEVMFREMPKHKASEKLQSELKQKISRAKKDAEAERKAGNKGHAVRIPRQGAGTVVILGGPNAGKSQLLARLTRATPEVAIYPFTTRTPLPGMMPWQDVMVQLIDTPPITGDFLEPYMQGLIRGADLALLVVDLGSDDGIEHCLACIDKLNQTKTRLAAASSLDEDDIGLSYTRTISVLNKSDLPDFKERVELWHEMSPLQLPELAVSAEQATALEPLKQAIYESLDIIRVYTKLPKAKEPDMERPFTVPRGSTLADVAALVHKELAEQLKFARIWGTGVHDGTAVKGDHVMHDRDIVEMHT